MVDTHARGRIPDNWKNRVVSIEQAAEIIRESHAGRAVAYHEQSCLGPFQGEEIIESRPGHVAYRRQL